MPIGVQRVLDFLVNALAGGHGLSDCARNYGGVVNWLNLQ